MARYEIVMNLSIEELTEKYFNHTTQLKNVMDTLAFMYQTFNNDDYKNAYNRCSIVLNMILNYKALY